MNKNLMFVTVGVLLLVGVIGALLLQIMRPEAIGTFIQQIVIIVGLLVSAAGTIYGLGQVNSKIDQVERNTNGRMSQLIEQNSELQRTVASQTGTIPVQAPREDD